MTQVDLNCDMGESTSLYKYDIEKDFAILQYVSSVNLACGYHAGDPHTMHRLVEAALKRHVAIGAHPSFPDRDNFGRTDMHLPPESVYDIILYQLGALQAFLQIYNAKLHHVKAHGALYNMAARDETLADALCNAVKDFDENLIIYGLSGSQLIRSAEKKGLRTASEVFADRTYREDGSLTPRTEPGALICDLEECIRHVLQMVQSGSVCTQSRQTVLIRAETVCIHGDGEQALPFAAAINASLKQQHVSIQQP